MLKIHQRLYDTFPGSRQALKPTGVKTLNAGVKCLHEGAHFILQLHDELYYEVASKDVLKVAKIVKECMENAIELSVNFPVSLKIGPSWGELVELSNNEI